MMGTVLVPTLRPGAGGGDSGRGGGQVPLALLLIPLTLSAPQYGVRTVTPAPLSLQMYIALISLHALIMVGFHFLHCFEEDWTSECGQGSPPGAGDTSRRALYFHRGARGHPQFIRSLASPRTDQGRKSRGPNLSGESAAP